MSIDVIPTPTYVAEHEAGHVVMVLFCRGSFTSVDINPVGDTLGETHMIWHRQWDAPRIAAAGPIAESLAELGGDVADVDDVVFSVDVMRSWLDPHLRAELDEAGIFDTRHVAEVLQLFWPHVQALADALREHKSLAYAEVVQLLATVDGPRLAVD